MSVKWYCLICSLACSFNCDWGERYIYGSLLFSTVFDYTNGLLLEYFLANKERFVNYQKYRKIVLTVSVVGNLGILCFFKYTEFLLTSLRDLTGTDIHIWKLALPIGISFYTFQTLSYTIDMYRGKTRVQKSFLGFLAYVSMFPQLVAGPIVAVQYGCERTEQQTCYG